MTGEEDGESLLGGLLLLSAFELADLFLAPTLFRNARFLNTDLGGTSRRVGVRWKSLLTSQRGAPETVSSCAFVFGE